MLVIACVLWFIVRFLVCLGRAGRDYPRASLARGVAV